MLVEGAFILITLSQILKLSSNISILDIFRTYHIILVTIIILKAVVSSHPLLELHFFIILSAPSLSSSQCSIFPTCQQRHFRSSQETPILDITPSNLIPLLFHYFFTLRYLRTLPIGHVNTPICPTIDLLTTQLVLPSQFKHSSVHYSVCKIFLNLKPLWHGSLVLLSVLPHQLDPSILHSMD